MFLGCFLKKFIAIVTFGTIAYKRIISKMGVLKIDCCFQGIDTILGCFLRILSILNFAVILRTILT